MLNIEYIDPKQLVPYEGNAKKHPEEQIRQIKDSIERYGMRDPIAVWKNNEVIEGHGRLIACIELGMDSVPIIRLDDMTNEQRREYMLVHNQLTMNSGWDFEKLSDELATLDFGDIDFGFDAELEETDEGEEQGNPETVYSKNAKIPQYEPTGKHVTFEQMCDATKTQELIQHINDSGISDKEKEFLIAAAQRHNVFNYTNIAEYYANDASPEMQKLMEESALVIIDVDDAIANGYVKLSKTIEELIREDYGDEV